MFYTNRRESVPKKHKGKRKEQESVITELQSSISLCLSFFRAR